jgi:hypothetical protein
MDLKEEGILAEEIRDHHWYYVSKGRAMREFLADVKASEVLDVGAGSGVFARQLLDAGLCESAVCVDPNYAEERTERHHGKSIRFVKSVDRRPRPLILMMDVLEHVRDDCALLEDYVAAMDTGGHVFITVPAFQFLWSGHDVFLEHYRRYTIETLEALVRKSGLTPVRSRYFFGSLFPFVAANRLIKRMLWDQGALTAQSELRLYPGWINSTLIAVHDVERRVFFGINKLFGLSAFCLCRRI